jgi:hypothetical protein
MNEEIKELIKLSTENPELEILTMVAYEVCAGDDHPYWMGEIEIVKKDVYLLINETVYIGKEDILNHVQDNLEFRPEYENLSDEEFDIMVNKEYDRLLQSGEIKEAIIVYIGV